MMNYSTRPAARPIRNGKRLIAHMTIASEIRKVRTLIDDTILTVENLHRSLAHTANMTGLGPADAKKTASRLEASLNTLRKRREELGGF